ncbi:MAG: DUF937 domain-containing protein [Pyrinomonadaceae bacterium]
MFSLEDLLGQQGGSEALGQISNMLGADRNVTDSAIQMALPVILNGLANNASSAQGAQSLNNALEQDHDGSILDMLGGFLGGGTAQTRQTDGGGILGHILGTKQGQVANEISNKSGLDIGQVAKLLITLAPIVMGFLGKQKQQNNLDAGGISDLLTGQQQQMQSTGNPMMDLASRMLDRDGDGSALDDLASMAAGYFTNR